MNDPRPISPRARLQELLAVPERLRTDEQWDELHELEIALAPGNREGAPDPSAARNPAGPSRHAQPGGGPRGKKPARKFHNRPPRGKAR